MNSIVRSDITKTDLDSLTYEVIGAAITVHKEMGSGLLESVYHACMKEELSHKGLKFLTELRVPVFYREKELGVDFRCDLLVENALIVELKAMKDWHTIHEAQILTYMRLLQMPKGIIINFTCKNIFNDG